MSSIARRPAALVVLLVTAVAGGAVVGLGAACFIWLYEEGVDLVWTELPDRLDINPYESWWLFAIPIAGGALVGLGQRFLGNYPIPIDDAIATWRAGGRIEPRTTPRTFVNSAVALVAGGPLGFEAALTGLLGGTGAWASDRIGTAGHMVRQAWGAERVEGLPHPLRALPYWLVAVAGLVTYRWLPFGALDLGFRFGGSEGALGVGDVLVVVAFAALVTVPVAWAIEAVRRAERAVLFRRSPVLVGMAGGLLFAVLALGDEDVLFSGQESIQHLEGTAVASLLYLTVAKILGLVIALVAGWRGGPVFPTFLAVSALAVAVDGAVGIGADLVMIGGIAAVSVVFLRGNIVVAFVLALYAVPLSYTGVILVGAVGAAAALAVARALDVLPTDAAENVATRAGEGAAAPAT